MKKIPPFLSFFAAFIFIVQQSQAQSVGDYRSVASGKWSDVTTWQTFDGVNWINAIIPPSNASGITTITSSDSISVTDTVFADQVVIESGAKLDIYGRFSLMNGAGTDMLANGNIVVEPSGNLGNDTLIGGASIEYKAAELFTAAGVSPTITFDAAVPQTIDGPGYFGFITLDNPNNLTITGSQAFTGVNFVNGKIIATGSFLVSQYSGIFTGQGPTRFIDGNLVCILYDASSGISFNLPIGKNGHYLPMILKAQQDQAFETELTVSIIDSAAPAHTLPASIDKVSTVRYFNISRNSDPANIISASLELSYDSTDAVTDPANLRIAKSDTAGGANNWVDLGGIGSAVTNGTITTTVNFTGTGSFALANATGGTNILPLHFIYFTAALNKQQVGLKWATASEVNTSYFNVERLDAATGWKTIGSVSANKNSSSNKYTFTDETVNSTGTYVYRIKEFDKDGSFYFSNEVLVRIQRSGKMDVKSLYPNPARDVLNYYVSAPGQNDAVTVTITSANGKLLFVRHSAANKFMQVGIQKLAGGTYFVTFTNESTGEKIVKKVVKM